MEKIRVILKEENIAGVVLLHVPGFVEVHQRLDTSWSCVRAEEGRYVLKTNLQEDFADDKELYQKKLMDSFDMLFNLSKNGANVVMPIGHMTKLLAMILGIEGPPGGKFTSVNTQNN